VFDVPRFGAGNASAIMVVVEAEGGRVALLVDELLGQQQVVVKNLEANYRRVEGVSGATIMGDGRVALILDVGSIVRRSRH
jgi:two-component system chemotaxis sensor kinase CheA